jgi:L-seryl-tRNA(Ser) seleniumtransferase
VHKALHADAEALRGRCEAVTAELAAAGVDATVVPSVGVVGGGGAPGVELPGWAVSLPEHYAAALRTGDPCVVGRLERGRCLLDLRCVPADADTAVTKAVLAV